jgi:hypothetical protein
LGLYLYGLFLLVFYWHFIAIVIDPDEEIEIKDPNYVGPLSYKKVKRH